MRRASLLSLILLTACQPAILDPRGPVGLNEKAILVDSLAIMLAIVVPTIAATLGFAWWFRASNARAIHLPDWAYSGRIELIVWSVPLLVIILLGGVAWIGSHELDPGRKLDPAPGVAADTIPLEVQVVSLDWKWLFIYPGQRVASVNELVLPVGIPVHFALTSGSVMTAFFIPRLGSMIYTMNRMETQLNLRADGPGEYLGLATHFSGDRFSDMRFQARAVPAGEFAAWIETARKSGPVLDAARYTALSEQSTNATPFTFRSVDPALFHDIVSQTLPPAPGPRTDDPRQNVSPRGEH